ncbi:MAG: hypothetical protein KF860_14765 [Cyclobacteriaceae bacterium]|nr:hypothetical protein [Cyclobacteriaceae bacterium]
MEKVDIVEFLEQKRRGVYNVIVNEYWSTASSVPVNLALSLIKKDLELSTGKKVDLKYVSLAQAISKAKGRYKAMDHVSNTPVESFGEKKKYDFKDAHELTKSNTAPGRFKLD